MNPLKAGAPLRNSVCPVTGLGDLALNVHYSATNGSTNSATNSATNGSANSAGYGTGDRYRTTVSEDFSVDFGNLVKQLVDLQGDVELTLIEYFHIRLHTVFLAFPVVAVVVGWTGLSCLLSYLTDFQFW
jgi:hypothetical protein